MASSTDYWALAHEMLTRAKAGDAQAQYMMWRIDRDCHDGRYEALLKKFSTLDEALRESQQSWRPPTEPADVTVQWNRCHRYLSEDAKEFGDKWEWLARSTDSGYGPAEVTTANFQLLKAEDRAFPKMVTEYGHVRMGGSDAEPRALFQTALKNSPDDPDVLLQIGENQHLLHPEQSHAEMLISMMAWRMLSCQRGADCSQFGAPTLEGCEPQDANCKGVPSDLLQAMNNDWTPVARRMEAIETALRNGQWDQIP